MRRGGSTMKGQLVRLLHKVGFVYETEDKASATEVWKKERVTVHVRPGSFTIDNGNNIFQVGTSLNELKEKVLAYLPELAYQLVPVEAYGVKGVQSKQWRKT